MSAVQLTHAALIKLAVAVAMLAGLAALWDRLFGTSIAQPRGGHAGIRIGLTLLREPEQQTLIAALVLPLLATPIARENHDA